MGEGEEREGRSGEGLKERAERQEASARVGGEVESEHAGTHTLTTAPHDTEYSEYSTGTGRKDY